MLTIVQRMYCDIDPPTVYSHCVRKLRETKQVEMLIFIVVPQLQ